MDFGMHPIIRRKEGKKDLNINYIYVNLHWGTVADGNRFIPSRRYIFASPEERTKLVLPKDWDLSEANKLSGAKAAGRPAKPKTTTLES